MALSATSFVGQPLVSVVIPSYNHAQFVQQTIQSVIDQDYANIELIIIDDGSSDASVHKITEMVPACESRFVRFSFRSRTNKGLSATLNEAIGWASGTFFSAIASDDIMFRTKTSRLLDHIINDAETAGVFCGSQLLDIDGEVVGTLHCANAVYDFDDILLCRHTILAPTQLLRLASLREVGGYRDGIYIEDWYMWLALSEKGYTLRVVDELLVGYRQHGSNISSNAARMYEGRMEILSLYRDNINYTRSLAVVRMWASIDFTSISKMQSIRFLIQAFQSDKRIALTRKFYECVLRVLIPRPVLLWFKRR